MTLTQQQLIDDLTALLKADDRVRGLWLSGSFGTGQADEFSDVDTLVAVDGDHRDSFLNDWPAVVEEAFAPVWMRRLGDSGLVNHILPGWLRLDVVVVPAEEAGKTLRVAGVRELINRDSIEPQNTVATEPADPQRVLAMTEEFLRILGLLAVVIGRGEFVTAASGAAGLRSMVTGLLQLRVEGKQPSGALHLSRVLDQETVDQLTALPAVRADRDSAIALHLASAAMFLPVAEEMLGADYPAAMERACWERLEATIGVDRATAGR